MADIACRPASPGDLDAVRALACAFDRKPPTPADEAFHARYARILGRDDWVLLLAEHDGAPVGYALVQDYGPGLRRAFATGRMHDLYVDGAHRRRGAGRALMQAVVAWCAERPAPMILDWSARPDSVPFYDSLGLRGDTVGDNARYPAYSIDLRERPPGS